MSRNRVPVRVPCFQYDLEKVVVRAAGWSKWGGGGFPACPATLGGGSGRCRSLSTCADELRLMGVGRSGVSTEGINVERGGCSFVRNSSSACVPPAMERMWRGPCGDGANCIMQLVESGERLRERRCAVAGRFLATKGSRS